MDIPYTVSLRPDTGLNNGKIGIWLFLASEVMLFGSLFATYIMLRVTELLAIREELLECKSGTQF